MQTIRKISSLKPTAKKGFFNKLEVYKQPLAFKRSTFSRALSSQEKCSIPAKNVEEQSPTRAGKKGGPPNNVGLEESGKTSKSLVSPTIGKSGKFKPKHVMVLHIPPNSQIEKNIENIGQSLEPARIAALVSADAITDDGLVGEVNTAQITAIKFDNVKSKKLMLVPLVIYENAQLSTATSDHENDDKEITPAVECECSIATESNSKKTKDGNEVFSFQLPNNLGPNLQKTPISSMKVDFQMVLPDVEKVIEDYVDLMRSSQSSDNNLYKSNSKSLNAESAENDNITEKFTPNGIIPLDFKAEISGFLGLSMDQLDEKKLQEVRDLDFKNLITTISGNLASIAIQKTYEHVEQRNFSTSIGNSCSNLFQTYNTNIKKSSDVPKAEISKANNNNKLIEQENLSGESLTTAPTTPISKISDSHTATPIISTINVTEKTELEQGTRDLESIEKGKLEKNVISSRLENEIPPVIYSECYVFSENLPNPKNYASKGSQIYDHASKPNSTNTSGGSESHMTQKPKELERQADENKLTNCALSTTLQIKSHFASEGNKSTKDTIEGMSNKSTTDCNENKRKDSDAKNKDSNTDCSAITDVGCTVLFKKNYFPLDQCQLDEIKNGLRNYALDCAMLPSFYQASKWGKESGVKRIDCFATKSGSKKEDEKSKTNIDCTSEGKEKGSESNPCAKRNESKSNPCAKSKNPSIGKIDPCSPFTSKRESSCVLFKKKCDSSCGKQDQNQEVKFDCSTLCKQTGETKGDKKSSSKIDCSAICGKKTDATKKDDKKSKSKIDCSSLGGKKTAQPGAKEHEKKSGTKIDCSAISGKKDAKKSDSKMDCSAICGKKTDSGKKDEKKLESRIQCSATGEKKSGSKIDCSAICGKKDDQKSKPKIDCSALGGKKSESKIDCSAICGKKDEKKSKPKIDCSALGGKKSESKIDCSAICGKKDEKKSKPKIDCSALGGKKSESKIDCSAICGKKDEKKSKPKIDCSALGGKKSESKIDCSAICGKKDEKKSKPKIDCSALGGKKSESKIDCSAICGKKDEKKSKPKIDCSALGGKKSESKIDCSAICGKKDENKSKPKIDCSALGGKKSESKIDCSAICGKKDEKKSKPKIDCSALGGKKSESKIDCSAICGKKDEKKSKPKIDCSALGGKKSESKIDCSAICGKKDEKKSKPKIDCSALGGKKSESKIDCSAICGKKDEKKSKPKIDCSALGGKKSESKIDCSAICGKKDENKSKPKIDCSALGGKKSESKIDCSAICGKKDEKKSKPKIDCSALGGKKSESKIDCSAICGKKDENKSKPKIDCSALGGKKSESKIDCSAICGKKDENKSKPKIDCSALGGKKSGSKIDCSAICGKKDEKKSKPKIDCSALGGKKSESKIDCSAICGKKDEKKSKPKIDCSALGGKKSESKIDCSAICGKKDEKKSKPKIDCSALGGKKSESKIDCSAICGKKDEKKSKPKIDCSALGGKKSESKIDCSAICGKKDENKSKPKIDCSALGGKKSESKIDCSAICGKKDEKKSKPKIDCSALGGKKSDNPCGKKPESKIACSELGGKKSESKIDCSAICGKKDEKKSKPKIDCSALGGKKSESKIDCSAICGKKDEKKSKPKIDCSALGGKKSESKIDCSAICGKKDENKSKPKIDCSALGGKKSESKIDCSAICGKKDEKKSKPKIDCSALGGKKSESKIDCSAICGKKDEKKSNPKIDCSALGGKKSDNPCGKKPESKIACSELGGKKSESKIDCSAICGKKDDVKLGETKSGCQCGMKDCQCGKRDSPCAVQTIKIYLTQGMHIEITTAQINKENIQIVQDMLSSKLNSKPDTDKAGKSGALNCITLVPEEEAGEVTIGPVSIFFDDPTKLFTPYRAEKKLKGDKRNQNTSPFIGGDVKSYSTDSGKSPEIKTRPAKRKYIVAPGILRGKSNAGKLKQSGCITYLNPEGNIPLQEHIPNSCSSEPEKMIINKIVKIIDCREVCLDSIPVAPIGDYDVLLKVDTVALSGSDLYMYETGAKTENVVSLGHEASGVVEKIGKHVTNINVGDHVAVEPGVPCGTCDNCKRGRYNICRDTIFNGSLAKYCVHPADFCHKLPDQCNLEEGALIHPLALGLYACNRANVSVKSNVLIVGACPLGLCCILCAKAMGARYVTIVDTLEKNIEIAQKLGADIPILLNENMTNKDIIQGVLSSMTRIGHPNVVINCSGCTKSLNTAVMCLAPGGVCVLAGCQTECGYFNILEALMKEINMVSSFRSCNTFPHAISLLDNCKTDLYHLITHRYLMSDIKRAFETALDEQTAQAVKVIIKCQEECNEPMPEG